MRDMIFKPGDGCGAFSILSFVGSGGTSDIYKAIHSATREVVALKCRRLCEISDPYVVDHVLAEAELLSKLNHENVVRIHEVGIDDGVIWMAMELLSGVTLRGLIKQSGALSVPAALYYAREIAEGVSALHKKGVIHGDLKPENVMITEQNKVKVLDTGAAKIFSKGIRQTKRGMIMGTPLYVSPEHLREEPLDARSDVYSLGLTLYEMISGRHPLRREGEGRLALHEIIVRQFRVNPPPLAGAVRGVPRYVSNFVRRATAKDREMRPGTMEEFALSAGSLLTAFVEETQAIFATPEIVSEDAKPVRLGGARDDQLSPEDVGDTTDDNLPTIDLNAVPNEPRSSLPKAAYEPAAEEPVQAEQAPLDEGDEEMDLRQTLPHRSDRRGAPSSPSSLPTLLTSRDLRTTQQSAQSGDLYASKASLGAASMPDSLPSLDVGWSPTSMSPPVVELRRARSFKRHLPVALGAMIMALSVAFVFGRAALPRPNAAALATATLVNLPSLVSHVHISPQGSAGEVEMPGAITLPASDASAGAQPGAVVPKTTSLCKQSSGPRQWRRGAALLSAEPLAGSRHYPEDESVTPPRPKARSYSPTDI